MSPHARLALLAALCCALSPRARGNQFGPIQAAGPASLNHMLSCEASINAWVFVDFFAGVHDRMFMQVCVGPVLA